MSVLAQLRAEMDSPGVVLHRHDIERLVETLKSCTESEVNRPDVETIIRCAEVAVQVPIIVPNVPIECAPDILRILKQYGCSGRMYNYMRVCQPIDHLFAVSRPDLWTPPVPSL